MRIRTAVLDWEADGPDAYRVMLDGQWLGVVREKSGEHVGMWKSHDGCFHGDQSSAMAWRESMAIAQAERIVEAFRNAKRLRREQLNAEPHPR